MIPKIIHYCWLSDDSYPENIQRCIDSWKKYLPDYEIILWNFERFPRGKSKWVDQSFDSHRYAFAADYLRLYALYYYGGIYLDSDVEVLKPFDDLLHLPYFLGQENTTSGVEAATMGFEKGNELIKVLLDSYKDRNFINPDGSYNDEALPYIIRRCIEARYDYTPISNLTEYVEDKNRINVLPIDWFSPKHWQTKEIHCTKNTYSIHHFAASWKSGVEENTEVDTPSRKQKERRISKWKRQLCIWLCNQAIKHSHFASLFLRLYYGHRFFLSEKMWIYKPDYKEILHLDKPLKEYDIEFILPEASRYNNPGNVVPIAKIKETNIELHYANPGKYELVRREDFISEFKKK